MKKHKTSSRLRKSGIALAAVTVLGGFVFAGAHFGAKPIIAADTPDGDVKSVIVKFKNVGGVTSAANASRQQAAIEKADKAVASATPYAAGYKQQTRSYENLPYAAYDVDAAGEDSLKSDPNIEYVFDDEFFEPSSTTPIPIIGGLPTGEFTDGVSNYDGSGYAVAIIDSGVDKNHALLSGKVIAEACFGYNGSLPDGTVTSYCPGGATFSSATDSALDCDTAVSGCGHGSHVAGIAAMPYTMGYDIDGDTIANDQLGGVATGADIIAVQVFSEVSSPSVCPGVPGNVCIRAVGSTYIAAMDYIASLSAGVPIAAANMSLGSGPFSADITECATSGVLPAIEAGMSALRASNIAPVASNGNDGDNPAYYGKIGSPACANGAIAVGATNVAGDQMASYSNNGNLTDILAPGGDYDGVNPDSRIWSVMSGTASSVIGYHGTSMAAPMVAGAFAVLREAHPNASVSALTSLMQSTGVDVTDTRTGYNNLVKPRLDLAAALAAAVAPTISSFTGPGGTVNEGASMTVNATVADATSCSLNNGVGAVTITGGTTISATIPVKASYTLTCSNGYGDSVTSVLNSTVNAAPTVPAITEKTYNEEAQTYTINWTASTDTDGVQEYRVYLNGQLVATLGNTATSYTFANILSSASYTFEVRAVDTLGAISTAASETYGSSGSVEVPNTGGFLFQDNSARSIIVAVLGVATTIIIVSAARRYARNQR